MARGDDPIGLFLDAIIESSEFRAQIGSGVESTIRAALTGKGIALPSPYLDELVTLCITIHNQPNGWSLIDQLRRALMQGVGTLN